MRNDENPTPCAPYQPYLIIFSQTFTECLDAKYCFRFGDSYCIKHNKVPTFSDLILQLRETGNKHITKQ